MGAGRVPTCRNLLGKLDLFLMATIRHFPLLLGGLFLMVVAACSSTGGSGTVLEPLDDVASQAGEMTDKSNATTENTPLHKLSELLKNLGYEAVGMNYENETTLQLLIKVFSDPSAQNRAIQFVYTGFQMAYEPKAQSLTVGGANEPSVILKFIHKIPLRGSVENKTK